MRYLFHNKSRFQPVLGAKCNFTDLWHVILNTTQYKTSGMKQVLQRLLVAHEETHDKFHMGSTLFMILLFLTFWGVSFYVLVNSLA